MESEKTLGEDTRNVAHDGGGAYGTSQAKLDGWRETRALGSNSETRTVDTNASQSDEKNQEGNEPGNEEVSKIAQEQETAPRGEQETMHTAVTSKSHGETKLAKTSGRGAKKMTKHGRYTSDITLEEMKRYYHLPAYEAARRMGIGLTILKRLCRKFGVQRWPYQRRRFQDMEEEELLRSYEVMQKRVKLGGDSQAGSQPGEQAPTTMTTVDKSIVDLIIHTIKVMYSPTDRQYDQKELIEGLGGCITKLVEVLQEMNERLKKFNQQTGNSSHNESSQQNFSVKEESPMDILHQLFRASQVHRDPVPPPQMFAPSYPPPANGSSMMSSQRQYGMNHDVQSGFTPYRPSFANSYGMPGSSLLPVNQMNASRIPESQLWDILRELHGDPAPGVYDNKHHHDTR